MRKWESDNLAIRTIHETRGLAAQIGAACGISRTGVCMWKSVPPKHALIVARALKMPVHMVCPEVFPPPRKAQKSGSATRN